MLQVHGEWPLSPVNFLVFNLEKHNLHPRANTLYPRKAFCFKAAACGGFCKQAAVIPQM